MDCSVNSQNTGGFRKIDKTLEIDFELKEAGQILTDYIDLRSTETRMAQH